jgi:hypothetical protein
MKRVFTVACLGIVAAAISGCSFIDDFGSFSVRDVRRDGGPRDGGGGGNDAGCNMCPATCPGGGVCNWVPEQMCRMCTTPAPEGEVCTDNASCMTGLECFIGRCSRRCTMDSQCTHPALTICAQVLTTERPQYCLAEECDPTRQSACGAGAGCYLIGVSTTGDRGVTACLQGAGSGANGTACESDLDCASGWCQLRTDGNGGCHPTCYNDNPTGYCGIADCVVLGVTVQGRDFGFCGTPCTADSECARTEFCDLEAGFCAVRAP